MHKSVLTFTLVALAAGSVVAGCADNSAPGMGDDKSGSSVNTETISPNVEKQKVEASAATETSSATVTRSADSHTHGGAELAIVLEDNLVTVELESPLFNLLGFEHHPETASQKDRVKMAEKQLGQAESLFVFNSEAGCKLIPANKAPELFEDKDEGHDGHHDHDDHEKHNDHDDTHKDVLLQYEFQCAAPSSLSQVKVNLFEFFEDMVDIDVTYLGPATQKQVSMTRQNTQMNLSR